MPPGEGWFVDLANGEHIRIFEHAQAVLDNPKRFRIESDEISGMLLPKDRRKILMLAFSKEFVRVRASKGDVVMEYDHPDRNLVFSHLKNFLFQQGFLEFANIRINAIHHPGGCFNGNAKEFMTLGQVYSWLREC